ncbi:MAG TPA: tRNA uracil 4-sulfurtransferase ThiI [Nitrososphaerales archaeon]|nr:tRNA uracil 4-sulfurtransferase ThiI [Nitrososphaerales archaeon]
MSGLYVVYYSEIALKGKNRHEFVRALRRNMNRALSPLGDVSIDSRESRLFVSTSAEAGRAEEAISRVFGVAWFARASLVKADYDSILAEVLKSEDVVRRAESFKVSSRRSGKSFPLSSMELDRRLGAELAMRTRRPVNLDAPGAEIRVDVLNDSAIVYSKKIQGAGGLPVGAGGRVMHLFSGGIDSPVAAWLLMKRGCKPIYVHFYLAPGPAQVLESKIPRLLKTLAAYCGRSTMVLVPFAEYQLATGTAASESEPSLFRRFMRATAESLAPHFGAQAVSTGDSLSQAASQTLWNIGVFDEGSSLPVLRPLLAYDKEEIISLAKRLGTYEASIEEYKDCCAIITRHPKTRVRRTLVNELAAGLGFPALVERCIAASTLVSYDPAKDTLKSAPFLVATRSPGGSSQSELLTTPRKSS